MPVILADEIRSFTYKHFILPELWFHGCSSFTAGDVHGAMKFTDRVPAVCSALGSQTFLNEYKLKLIRRSGRPVSTRTHFVFGASTAHRLPDVSTTHLEAFNWFERNTGKVVAWSELNSRHPKLAISPKGIYRPAGWKYALSIKIISNGRYADEEPTLVNGRMEFRYHQEQPGGARPETYFTNVGLQNCMADGVPVGIIRQTKAAPGPLYEVVGLGSVVDWKENFFVISLSLDDRTPADIRGVDEGEPLSLEDARHHVERSIVERRGQQQFRDALFRAYGGRCVVSHCSVSSVLEAAHIKPYLGAHTNRITNGLLLRADLHTLFDLGLLRIEPCSRSVVLAESLQGTEYEQFEGRELAAPLDPSSAPALDCLEYAWQAASLAREVGDDVGIKSPAAFGL